MIRCPECGQVATLVWKSKDGKTIALKCTRSRHKPKPIPQNMKRRSYYFHSKPERGKFNTVFLVTK